MAGTLTLSTLSDGTNSTSATNPIKGSARAWVNFDGTGTVTVRDSFNVSSITDNGTGDYTLNFTNAMPNVNYSIGGNAMRNQVNGNNNTALAIFPSTTYSDAFISTTQFRFVTQDYAGGKQDCLAVTVQVFSS
jgi:hypothetical protein